MTKKNTYDLIIIGAGHAGCEAAHSASVLGLKTIIITLNIDAIALLPCNPSIGGPGKSHLVSEIDSLGGLMGKIADIATIQKKILNKKKGPAVQALRVQVDRQKYSKEIFFELEKLKNLDILQGEVEKILLNNNKIKGVKLKNGIIFYSKRIIVTTGTYLCSNIIIGKYIKNTGPNELTNSIFLSKELKKMGFIIKKFKTGTPPRLDKRTIDYEKIEIQKTEKENAVFSFYYKNNKNKKINQAKCYLTYTTKKTTNIIKKNLEKSPLFLGIIKGIGPRYCPSIEDKIIRFPEKVKHHLFIEPEGFNTNEVYLQGFSTSMPSEIQGKLINSIIGLEKTRIIRYAYAIEYDVINPQELKLSLESKKFKGLFFAGQINGTSGYEEAAAQGIIAGINASLSFKNKKPLILKRSEAYIGVLIDDLITKGTNEPYRMFTARAEYRLLLRQSNSDDRLIKKAYKIGMIDKKRYNNYLEKKIKIEQTIVKLKNIIVSNNNENIVFLLKKIGSSFLQNNTTAYQLLKRPEIKFNDLIKSLKIKINLSSKEKEEVFLRIKYSGYIKKQINQVKNFNKYEKKIITLKFKEYNNIKGLTKEAVEKFNKIQPTSIGQASRISGVTPADIQVLLFYLEKQKKSKK